MHENPKTFSGDHLPSRSPPLGLPIPLSPTITEALPPLKDINSLVCGRDIDQHNTSS